MNIANYLIHSYKKTSGYVIFCIVLFIVAFMLGMLFNKNLIFGYITNNVNEYNVFFDNDVSLFAYFFKKLSISLGLILFISLSSLIVYLIPLHCLIYVYQGLILGKIAISLVTCYSLIGLIIFILVIFPSYFLRILSLITLSALNCVTVKNSKKCDRINVCELVFNALLAFCVSLVGLMWELIILGLIIRPVSTYF